MFENINMKKVVIWLISIVIVCFGIGLLIFNITGGHKKVININNGNLINSRNSKEYKLNDEKSGSINGITEINAESACADINIITEKRNDVKVHMYGSINGTYEPKLYLNANGGNLEITTDKEKSGSFSIFESNLKLDIYIPENYNKSLNIITSSGNIDVNKIKLKSISGISVSGKLNLNDIACEELKAKSTSGALSGNNVIANSADFKSVSGSIDFTKFKGDVDGESVSGKINIDYSEFNNTVELKCISGNIELSLPSASQFKIQSKSVSGKISCEFPVTIEGSQERNQLTGTAVSDKNSIILNTTSGSININKK